MTNSKLLLEAHDKLIDKGIYPINILLHEAKETVVVAEAVEALEDLLESYQAQLPTLHSLVKLNGSRLLESKAPEQTLINYSFVCEALGKRVAEAARLLEGKVPEDKTLSEAYGKDGEKLVEFCFKKAQTLSLLEGDYSPVISSAAKDLAGIPFKDLKFICESVPSMRLYVSMETHKKLAKEVVGLNESAIEEEVYATRPADHSKENFAHSLGGFNDKRSGEGLVSHLEKLASVQALQEPKRSERIRMILNAALEYLDSKAPQGRMV